MSTVREKKLFFKAVEITDPQQREKFLQDACRGNEGLLKRINSLLSAASAVGNFLEFEQASDKNSEVQAKSDSNTDPSISLDFLEPSSNSKYIGKLSHYDVISLLGHGAFGIVLKAFDRRLHRQVAIKVLAPQLATTSPPRKRFLREARSCAAIKHPNVVHLYDVSDKPTPFIAMEYLDGQTLQERIDDSGPLEISEVIQIAEQLAAGLEAAHTKGLIHRDIKPSNIIVEDKGDLRAVLTDFGLARAADDASLTQSGVLTGTPIYMSPEQTKGQKLDARSDLFSLGSLLYVMLTGRPPFRARNTVAVLQRVANSKARPISEISPDSPEWLNKLVERLHEKDPEKRIQSATEVLKILKVKEDVHQASLPQANQPDKVVPDSNSEETKAGKGKWLVATVGMVALFLICWGLFNRPESSNVTAQSNQLTLAENQEITSLQAQNSRSATLGGAEPPNDNTHTELAEIPHSPAVWTGWSSDAPPPAVTPFDHDQAAQYQNAWAAHYNVPVEFTDQLGITYRLIPPGEFMMGTSEEGIQSRLHHVEHDAWWKENLISEGPQHKVAVTKPYYLATTEVTQNQFESIMSYNPAYFQKGGEKGEFTDESESLNFPMDHASWDEIQTFLKRLKVRTGRAVKGKAIPLYRLPTEAEWEFACRAGTQTDFWTGDDELDFLKHENVEAQLGSITNVGEYRPNPFGLYDIAGNVHEYVQDLWETGQKKPVESPITVDPLGPKETEWGSVVARGGDYWWWSYHSRSSYRIGVLPDERSGLTIGFRLALDVEAYPFVSDWKRAGNSVSGFSEVHGASRQELENWLSSIRGRYVPSRINLRWGSSSPLFDAVAIMPEEPEGDWQVNFFANDYEAGQDFGRMRKSYDIFWKLLIPQNDMHPMKCPGLKIWRQTDRISATWNIGDADLLTEINKASAQGALPLSLPYTESGQGKNSAYVQHHRPGFGNRSYVGLSLAEFKDQVEKHQQRNWHLHFFQLAAGTSELQINCTFRENLDQFDWEMSFDLTQPEFEQELHRRKVANWYPSCIGSYVDGGTVRYFANWEKMKVVRSSGGLGGRKSGGGFGGR